jgi:NAD+ synthase
VEALGSDRVLGVFMPNSRQTAETQLDNKELIAQDFNDVEALCMHLGIKWKLIDIGETYIGLCMSICCNNFVDGEDMQMTPQALINLAPRLRMATLYAISQSVHGRVANTCNLSEDWVGYSTRYGDSAGDFSPLSSLTTDEVIAVGLALGLPEHLVKKVPSDGVCGKSDEDNLGFTYRTLNEYLRLGVCNDPEVEKIIEDKHEKNMFKLQLIPAFQYSPVY